MVSCAINDCQRNVNGNCELAFDDIPVSMRRNVNTCTHRLFMLKMDDEKTSKQ